MPHPLAALQVLLHKRHFVEEKVGQGVEVCLYKPRSQSTLLSLGVNWSIILKWSLESVFFMKST